MLFFAQKENSELNNVHSKMAFMQTGLLSAFNENAKFDLILFNAPVPSFRRAWRRFLMVRSWAGGINGRQVIDQFISPSSITLERLRANSLMQSTLANAEETIRKFEEIDLKASIKAERKLPFFENFNPYKSRK